MAIFSSFVAAADARVRSRRPRRAAQITRAHVRRYKPRRRKVIPFLEKLVQLLQEEPDVIRRAARARNQFSRHRREA